MLQLARSALVVSALTPLALGQLGETYCPGSTNSTGAGATLYALGSLDPARSNLLLHVDMLPQNSVGYFVTGRMRSAPTQTNGSVGTLCIGGPIGRYSSFVLDSGSAQAVDFPVNLASIPTPNGALPAELGERLQFQYWYRDALPGSAPTSNFSSAIELLPRCERALFPAGAYLAGDEVFDVDVADFDGDQLPDILTTVVTAAGPVVLRGEGDGSFSNVVGSTLGSLESIHAVDLDLDGDMDVVGHPTFGNRFDVWQNLGGGVFGAGDQVSTPNGMQGLIVADFDGDGAPDVLTFHAQPPEIYFFRGRGGVFGLPQMSPSSAVVMRAAVGDFDLDGSIDFVGIHPTSNEATLFTGDGFGRFAEVSLGSMGPGPSDVAAADLDGDGSLEIAVALNGSGRLRVLGRDPQGAFLTRQNVAVGTFMNELEAVDVEGDGDIDLVYGRGLASAQGDRAFVGTLINGGSGIVTPGQEFWSGGSSGRVRSADLNGDGWSDIVTNTLYVSNAREYATVHLATGPGTFPETDFVQTIPPVSSARQVSDLALGDLDGDGRGDLVYVDFRYDQIVLHSGLAGGGFGPEQPLLIEQSPVGIDLVDVDADGRLDVATQTSFGTWVRRSLGGGALSTPTVLATGPLGGNVRWVDVDLDGALDLVSAADAGVIHWGRGDGTFDPPTVLGPTAHAWAIDVGDVDGDGLLDIVTASSATMNASTTDLNVRRGLGGRSFAAPLVSNLGPVSVRVLAMTDVDADGLSDVAYSQSTSAQETLEFRRSLGGGVFGGSTSVGSVPSATDLIRLDADGDGREDLLLGSSHSIYGVHVRDDAGFGPVRLHFAPQTQWVDAYDVDGDGSLELALSGLESRGVFIVSSECR